ncbi:MAG: TIGR00730 family Rossman fold protein [Anaerolineae bacterium]|nr:TIGR00730 family Rossman fold protein [Anaerolineae bacterium]
MLITTLRRGKLLHICVFCSSSSVVAPIYFHVARQLGELIATKGHTLVYGGANVGLMLELAQAVKNKGGKVVGVIPRRLAEYGLAFKQADEMIVTESLAERKAIMEKRADAFIALPGGFGTLEEVTQVITLKQLQYIHGAIVLLNIEGFYRHLLAHFEFLYHERFAKPIYRQLYYVASTPQEAMEHIEHYDPATLPTKWF